MDGMDLAPPHTLGARLYGLYRECFAHLDVPTWLELSASERDLWSILATRFLRAQQELEAARLAESAAVLGMGLPAMKGTAAGALLLATHWTEVAKRCISEMPEGEGLDTQDNEIAEADIVSDPFVWRGDEERARG